MKVFKRIWQTIEARINEIFTLYLENNNYFISRIEVCSNDECFYIHLQPNDVTLEPDVIRIEWDDMDKPNKYFEEFFQQEIIRKQLVLRNNKLNKIIKQVNVLLWQQKKP